jgi:predicted permease
MEWLRIVISRCSAIFSSKRLDEDLDAEMRTHIDLAMEDNLKSGLSPDAARSAALREFGGLTQIKESYRMQRGAPLVEQLGRDVRFGVRQLAKSPAFTLTAVLTLALGIGANSAVFSVLDSVLLRPLPFPNANRLVRILSVHGDERDGASPPDARDFARQNHTFEYLVVFDQWRKNVITAKTGDNPESMGVGLGPLELFQALGIHPILGRLFTADEGTVGRNHVALISQPFWRNRYARDPNILGRTITINGLSYSIVGVLPDSIPGWVRGVNVPLDVWEPFLPTPDVWSEATRGGRDYATLGLLKPGVSIQQADADLETVAGNLAATYPIDQGWSVALEPLIVARSGDLRPQLYLLMGAVTLILLIACSNLAALLLARNTACQREFAMRAALGARRVTLIRQILIETLLVSLLGGSCGVAFAATIDLVIRRSHPRSMAQLAEIGLDWRVLLFTFLIAVATSLVFGLAPAILNTRINFAEALKEGSRGSSAPLRHGFRKVLVIGQIALSLMLTVGAALLVQTIARLETQDMGFRSDHLLKAHFFLPDQQYPTPEMKTRFCDALGGQLRALPGVRDASITSIYPPHERWEMMFSLEGHPISRAQDIRLTFFGVTDVPYLKTAGIPIVKGRDFLQTDRENTPVVAIINQTFVNRFFRDADPLGKRILLGAQPGAGVEAPYMHEQSVFVTVVGVMADSKNDGLSQPVAPQLITLFRQMPVVNYGFKDFIVRSDVPPQTLEHEIEQRFHAFDPRLPLSEMMTITETVEGMTADKRFTSLILSAFAVLGLVLAVVGIYGVVSYLVAQRNQELGLRLALGAARSHVLWLVARQGLVLALAGVAIGLGGTAIASRGLSSLLFGISALDPLTLSTASLLLLLVALAACAIPARRATRIDPMQVLRTE